MIYGYGYGYGLFFKLKFHFQIRSCIYRVEKFLHPIQSNWTGARWGWIMDLNISDWR
jgi:hypothetical protein